MATNGWDPPRSRNFCLEAAEVLGDRTRSRLPDAVAPQVERGEAAEVLGDRTRSRLPDDITR
jgi:hypothetical protein